MISSVAACGAKAAQARTASPYSRVRYVSMTSPTSTYAAWRRLSGRPGGTRHFSAAAIARVPYFASVLPHVVRMEPGLAEARVPKWFMVKRVGVLPRWQPSPKVPGCQASAAASA